MSDPKRSEAYLNFYVELLVATMMLHSDVFVFIN